MFQLYPRRDHQIFWKAQLDAFSASTSFLVTIRHRPRRLKAFQHYADLRLGSGHSANVPEMYVQTAEAF